MERLIDLAKVIKQAIKRARSRIQISGNVSSLMWEMLNEECFSKSVLFFSYFNPQEQFCLSISSQLCFHIVVYTENGTTV